MRILFKILSIALLWQIVYAARTTFDADGNVAEVTAGYEESYPISVTAPLEADGPGPNFSPFPLPHIFTKAALLGAHAQALKKQGDRATYPKPWITNNEPSPYMEFPILTSGNPWTGNDPGRFRLLYGRSDNKFYKVVMHMYAEEPPLVNGVQMVPKWKSEMLSYGA